MFFFFFQAEDGIRDLTVTGVQTCALPIFSHRTRSRHPGRDLAPQGVGAAELGPHAPRAREDRFGAVRDRKSTRLNSSHSQISYAVFCLKKNNIDPISVHSASGCGNSAADS